MSRMIATLWTVVVLGESIARIAGSFLYMPTRREARRRVVKPAGTWLRDGKAFKGAAKTSYRITRTDATKRISVRGTETHPGHKTIVTTSRSKLVAARQERGKRTGTRTLHRSVKAADARWRSSRIAALSL